MKKGCRKRMALGGAFDPSSVFMTLGNFADTQTDESGNQDEGFAIGAGALRGASLGAKLGSVVPGVGNVVGAAAGAIGGGLVSAQQQKKIQAQLRLNKAKEREANSVYANQANNAKMLNYDTGSNYTSLYAKGGKLPFVLLNDNVVKVKGKKHEEGGVKLGNNIEVEGGEVIKENKVFSDRLKVKGTGKTYAEVAEKITRGPMYKTLAKNHEAMEKVANNPKVDQYRAGTAARNLQKTIQPLDNLFKMQEASKQGRGSRNKMALGGIIDPEAIQRGLKGLGKRTYDTSNLPSTSGYKLEQTVPAFAGNALAPAGDAKYNLIKNSPADKLSPDLDLTNLPMSTKSMNRTAPVPKTYETTVAGDRQFPTIPFTGKQVLNKMGELVPYIDNVTNAILTNKSPQVPVPKADISPRLKTTFYIQPQLASIDRVGAGVRRSLTNNVSDGSSLRASLITRGVQDIQAKNDLLGQKENIETDMKNKQAMLDSDTANRNTSLFNNYDLRKFSRTADIQTRVSQNAANLTEDLQQKVIDNKLTQRDEQDLALVYQKYSKSGVLDRAKIAELRKKISEGMTADEAMKAIADK